MAASESNVLLSHLHTVNRELGRAPLQAAFPGAVRSVSAPLVTFVRGISGSGGMKMKNRVLFLPRPVGMARGSPWARAPAGGAGAGGPGAAEPSSAGMRRGPARATSRSRVLGQARPVGVPGSPASCRACSRGHLAALGLTAESPGVGGCRRAQLFAFPGAVATLGTHHRWGPRLP